MKLLRLFIIILLTISITACSPAFILVKVADSIVCRAVLDEEFHDQEC